MGYKKVLEKKNGEEILLSICIPTYNREKYLFEIITFLENDFPKNYELVISDNGSTDNTLQLLLEKAAEDKFGNVCIYQSLSNQGPDSNFVNVANGSSGKFFWLLGSDDMPTNDYKKILKAIGNADFLLLNFIKGDKNLNATGKHLWFSKKVVQFNRDTLEENNQAYIFNNANPLWGFFFGYISSIVLKREAWDRITIEKAWIGSFFSFSFVIYRLFFEGMTMKYERDFFALKNRNYNDSMVNEFKSNAYLKRVEIDMWAYKNVLQQIKSKTVAESLKGLITKNYFWHPLLQYKHRLDKQEWNYINKEYFSLFFPSFNKFLLSFFLTPLTMAYSIAFKAKSLGK